MVTSDFSPEVEIRPFRACKMYPAIITGTVRSLLTWLWGRYHVPQNAFLVFSQYLVLASNNGSRSCSSKSVNSYTCTVCDKKASAFQQCMIYGDIHRDDRERVWQVKGRLPPKQSHLAWPGQLQLSSCFVLLTCAVDTLMKVACKKVL